MAQNRQIFRAVGMPDCTATSSTVRPVEASPGETVPLVSCQGSRYILTPRCSMKEKSPHGSTSRGPRGRRLNCSSWFRLLRNQ
eukprot:3717349-Amphidinium_carterae.1